MHYQQFMANNYEDEEESDEINQEPDIDEYYNYNEFLNPYINPEPIEFTLENIMDNLKTMLTNEK